VLHLDQLARNAVFNTILSSIQQQDLVYVLLDITLTLTTNVNHALNTFQIVRSVVQIQAARPAALDTT
jgi:hypothetical protein